MFDIREIAVQQITDENILFEIIKKYYDESNVKYGLNVVKYAVKQITDEDILMEISENNYDQEIIDSALEKVNKKI